MTLRAKTGSVGILTPQEPKNIKNTIKNIKKTSIIIIMAAMVTTTVTVIMVRN